VNRKFEAFPVNNIATFKNKMLSWVNRFNIFCLLDNHHYELPYHSQECILAAGTVSVLEYEHNFFSSLASFCNENKDWIFGHFNYDLKNEIENLESNHTDNIGFTDAFLFVPEIVIQLSEDKVLIGVIEGDAERIYREINDQEISIEKSPQVTFQPRISRYEYLGIIEQLKQHIRRGDCYEINFCQEFYAEHVEVNPLAIYNSLSKISPNPFAAFYRNEDKYLICSSPERYVKRTGNQIISQPIKGTAPRDFFNKESDINLKKELHNSAKDKSENVMIVDLVRNDLSRICKEGSVTVENLYEVRTFPYVHQMISTIKGELESDVTFADVLQATFPMGSMTGAPKKRVMELIEQYETTRRGLYSGTIGYISPDKNFDFNVVIRSLMYNASNGYLSYQVGGGITYSSNAEKEFEECLVKAEAIKKAL
jgi:para-aminobenzoate synthetase component 1